MQLTTGLEIDDPWEHLAELREHYYPAYDGVLTLQDNELRVPEIALSIMLNSRISGNTAWAIYQARAPIEAALAEIPADVDMLDVPLGQEIPGIEAIKAALQSMCEIRRVSLAVSTKVLAKKRPALIPIFDSRVHDYYRQFLPRIRPARTWAQHVEALILLFHQDMLSVEHELRDLGQHMNDMAMPLAHCRVLDHLIWKELG